MMSFSPVSLKTSQGNKVTAKPAASIQTKLTIGQPNDKYEQEADRVADQVVSTKPAAASNAGRAPAPAIQSKPRLQRVDDEEVQAMPAPTIMRMPEEELQARIQKTEDEEIQTKPAGNTPQVAPDSIQNQIEQSKGGGNPLSSSTRSFMESSIGADFSNVRIHNDSNAHKLSTKLNAQAFAVGNNVFFNQGRYNPESQSGKHLLAHELTHTVQQGASQESVQQKGISRSSPDSIQRFAFISGTQVDKNDPVLDTEMKAMASDTLVRDYQDSAEFQDHAAGQTDYLGNLTTGYPGLWVRFNPTGINILGENHTLVTLQDITPAVGTTSFIRERFSSDNMTNTPEMAAAYEAENQVEFQKMGIANSPNKQQYGGESLFPKMGFALTTALEHHLFEPHLVADISSPNYFGKPLQRYLKLAWAWSKDNLAEVLAQQAAGTSIIPQRETLASLHAALAPQLDTFMNSLVANGYLGDELGKPANSTLFGPIQQFALTFSEVVVEMAISDSSSRLSTADRTRMASSTTSLQGRATLFRNWRNYLMEDIVNAAATNGTRYAGMGYRHLQYLQGANFPSNGHAFNMEGSDLSRFITETTQLQGQAVP